MQDVGTPTRDAYLNHAPFILEEVVNVIVSASDGCSSNSSAIPSIAAGNIRWIMHDVKAGSVAARLSGYSDERRPNLVPNSSLNTGIASISVTLFGVNRIVGLRDQDKSY
jgi:hypothetical protein